MHDDDLRLAEDDVRRLGYDPRDINVPGIRKAVVGYMTFATLSVIASVGIYAVLVPWHCAGPPPAAMVPETRIPAPPNPLLQTDLTVRTDIADMLRQQNGALNSYGWVDKSKGVVHIPIENAIDLTAERGVPYSLTPTGREMTMKEVFKRP